MFRVDTAETVKTEQPSWTFFRGENFDGHSPSVDFANSWDAKGPPVLWSISLGQGYSGFVGAGDYIVTQYQTITGQFVICLDAKTGEKIWEHRYAWPYKPASLYPGPRSTPTINEGRVYFSTPASEIGCLNLKTGEPIWYVSLVERFGAAEIDFGFACSPVIFAGKLLIPAGGPDAAMVALDPETGETIWAAGDQKISYCSAFPVRFQNRDIVIGYFRNELALFDFQSGESLYSYRVSEDYDEHSAWPIFREPYLWVSGPFRSGSRLLEIKADDKDQIRLTRIYKTPLMSNDVASCVLVDDSLYGFDLRDVQAKVHRPSRGQFSCVDFLTGNVNWQNGSLKRRPRLDPDPNEMISSSSATDESDTGHVSLVAAEGKLFMLNDTGALIIADADSQKYHELGRWTILGGEIVWTAPSLIGNCLFARNQSKAVCVYLGAQPLPEKSNSSVQFAAEIRQPKFFNLANLVLGTEPKYAMTAPRVDWLASWYLISLALGWIIAPAIAWSIGRILGRIFNGLSVRHIFLVVAFLVGILGTTVAGKAGYFFFSWPMALAISFECLVCQLQDPKKPAKKGAAIWARLMLAAFVGFGFFYFWLCRKLSLAFEWSFLMGFPAALPFLWWLKASVQRQEKFSIRQWLLSLLGFSAFYWVGAGVIMITYGA